MPVGWEHDGKVINRRASTRQDFAWADRLSALALEIAASIPGAEIERRELIPVFWTRWRTAGDESVCAVCGPYAGRAWPLNEGPVPPLHPHCRCTREYAFTTWQTRDAR